MSDVLKFDTGTPRLRSGLFLDHEIEAMPDPEYLVDGYIEESALTVVYGSSSGGKTFALLDLALSIASGVPWHGREVLQGPGSNGVDGDDLGHIESCSTGKCEMQ